MSVILQFERKVEVIRQDYVIVTLYLVFGIRLKPLRNIYQRNLQSNKYGLASSSPLFSVVLYSSQLNFIISDGSTGIPIPRIYRPLEIIDPPKSSIPRKQRLKEVDCSKKSALSKNLPIASSY